jgi:DNA-binding beta-propeller fold protein YncE
MKRLSAFAVLLCILLLPATAQAAGNVYVANSGEETVSQYMIGAAGELTSLSPPTVATGVAPDGVAVTPDGKSAYFANVVGNTVSQYNIDPVTGALTPKTPATVASGKEPQIFAVTPDGKSAYLTNFEEGTVSQYDIDPVTGALTPKTPATVAAGKGVRGMAVSPDGKSAYVANSSENTVSQYNIDPVTGALTPKTPATVAAGTLPWTIGVSPDSKSAYVPNSSENTVSQYNIDPVTGALTGKTPATVAAGKEPEHVAVTPDGKSAYVTNFEEGTVSQYNIDPVTGALTGKTPATVAAGKRSKWIVVSPGGKSAYVTNFEEGTVSQYNIDPVTGALTAKTPATVATGKSPTGIAIVEPPPHPTTTSVSCSPSTVAAGGTSTCTATVKDEATSGASAPTGTVAFKTGGEGSFSGAKCTLGSPSTSSSSCSVEYKPSNAAEQPKRTDTITAEYEGDETHLTSNGMTTVTVMRDPTSTEVVCVPQLVVLGGETTCEAFVTDTAASGATTPTGTVMFTSHGEGNFPASCSLKAGVCSVKYKPTEATKQPKRLDAITAFYQGDEAHQVSLGSAVVEVVRHPTITSVSCSPSTVAAGSASTCTATVKDEAASGATAPTGTVAVKTGGEGTFSEAKCTLGSPSTSSSSCSVEYKPSNVAKLPKRIDTITAEYEGDEAHETSNGMTTVTVMRDPTEIVVFCDPEPVAAGGETTCTATVIDPAASGATVPTGTVMFTSSGGGKGNLPASCSLAGVGNESRCSVTYKPTGPSEFPVRVDGITASYQGDEAHESSTERVPVLVVTHATATIVKCSPQSFLGGQSTTCTATVKDEATSEATTPTGNVAFKTGGSGGFNKASCALAGSGATATCAVTYTPTATTAKPERTDTITAEYEGDETHVTSKGTTGITVFSPTALVRGAFAIGNNNATVGGSVTFYEPNEWSKLNSLSGGSAPASFGGFAESSASPPTCGETWTTKSGTSSTPPATVPEFMEVVVASKITKSGSTISGNAPEVVVVRTSPGYSPTKKGTGKVVAIVCSS